MSAQLSDPKMLECPALITIKLISGKWKTRILWHLRSGTAGWRPEAGLATNVWMKPAFAFERDGYRTSSPGPQALKR